MSDHEKILVSVGIPAYNRPDKLERTLKTIIHQTYTDLEIIISVDYSEKSDVIEKIVQSYMKDDPRIHFYRHSNRIGMIENFGFVLKTATGKYFMWSSDDDEWSPKFIESTLACLENDSNSKMAFSNMVSIDAFGNVIRYYLDYARFTEKNKLKNLMRFVFEPEVLGKANLMYSLFERKFCTNIWTKIYGDRNFSWGADNGLALCALLQTNVLIVDDVLFFKRLSRPEDSVDDVRPIKIVPFFGVFPFAESLSYTCNIIRACKGTCYWPLVFCCMLVRMPHSLLISMMKTLLLALKIYVPIEADNAGI